MFSSGPSFCSRNSSLRASTIVVEQGLDRVVTTGHLHDPDKFELTVRGKVSASSNCSTISLNVGRDLASNCKIKYNSIVIIVKNISSFLITNYLTWQQEKANLRNVVGGGQDEHNSTKAI